ncbi:MAG: thermonuclease family protein, partial [Planctomycetes bacterium]|nr:thermonuclease family protein [Planctomycetota bacterium]
MTTSATCFARSLSMNPRLAEHLRIDRRNHPHRAIVGVTIAIFIAGQTLLAQSSGGSAAERPRGKPTKVERVAEAGRVAVKLDGKECELALAGVEWPNDETEADAAQEFLERLLDGESVAVEVLREEPGASQPSEGEKIQRAYFRRMPDGLFLNVELVRLGFARVQARPSFEQLAAFREAEKRARDRGVGVWAGGDKTTTPKAGQRRPQGREKPAD